MAKKEITFAGVVTKGQASPAPGAAQRAPAGEPGELVNLNFKVPGELKDRIKMASAKHRRPIVDLMNEAFEQWLDRQGD